MKRFCTAEILSLAALVCLSTGCARWTIFPNTATPVPQAEDKPNSRPSLLQAVGLDRTKQQPDQAAPKAEKQSMMDDLRKLDPALALARLAERQGSASEARRQYQQFIDTHPTHPMPHHRLGVMAAREAKYDEAEVHFQTAAGMGPPSAELLSDMGYLLYLQDRLPEAENLLRQACQLEPANQSANNNLALVLAARGNFDNSLRQFRTVNSEAEARANLAYTHSHHGDLEKAREEYLRALTLDNSLKSAAQALLQVEEARKREQMAVAQYQQPQGVESDAGRAQAVPQQRQPQAMTLSPQRAAPPQYVEQASYGEQYNQFAATDRTNSPPPVRRDSSADMLMPVPNAAQPAAPHQPMQAAGHGFREVSSVQPAGYIEPAQATLATPRFQQPPRDESATFSQVDRAAAGQDSGWNSAWQQLSTRATAADLQVASQQQANHSEPERANSAGGINLSDSIYGRSPAAQPNGGVRISIGDE